jgi:hypothetical protein
MQRKKSCRWKVTKYQKLLAENFKNIWKGVKNGPKTLFICTVDVCTWTVPGLLRELESSPPLYIVLLYKRADKYQSRWVNCENDYSCTGEKLPSKSYILLENCPWDLLSGNHRSEITITGQNCWAMSYCWKWLFMYSWKITVGELRIIKELT